MSEPVVYDLDVLRPQPVFVKLGGQKIDISFVPSGVAMDAMRIQQELIALVGSPDKMKKLEDGSGGEAQRSFELSAELCASITKAQHPEMDKDWLLANTDVIQLKALIDHVTKAVFASLNNVEDKDTKKQPAAKGENP